MTGCVIAQTSAAISSVQIMNMHLFAVPGVCGMEMLQLGSIRRVKRPKSEADNFRPSPVKINNLWSYTSTPHAPVRHVTRRTSLLLAFHIKASSG